MTKIYRIDHDTTRYQTFAPVREEDSALFIGDGRRKEATWYPPEVHVPQPWLVAGDFYQPNNSILIANQRATEVLYGVFLSWEHEQLPLVYAGQVYTVFNAIDSANSLNAEATEWQHGPDGVTRLYPSRYVFHPDRFSGATLFKIPETCTSEILALKENIDDVEEVDQDVLTLVQRAGLRGIRFTLLWESGEKNSPESAD